MESLPEHQKKPLLTVIYHEDMLTKLSNRHGESVIFQLLSLMKGCQKLFERIE